jgi:hypothetical protein
MPDEVTVTVENPSSKDSNAVQQAEPIPQPQLVIAAAMETGKAAQAAESAAEEATQSATKAEQLLAEIRNAIRPELEEISERLANLEAMEEEEAEEQEPSIIPAEEDGILTTASVSTVTLDEPPKVKEEIQTKQSEMPQGNQERGGFLRRIFLNR